MMPQNPIPVASVEEFIIGWTVVVWEWVLVLYQYYLSLLPSPAFP